MASGGVIAKWHKTDVAFVAIKEVLLTIETDKVNLEVVAEHAGKLQIKLSEGERIEAGSIVAHIETSAQQTISAGIDDEVRGRTSTNKKTPNRSMSKVGKGKHSQHELSNSTSPIGLPPPPEHFDPKAKLDFVKLSQLDYAALIGLPPPPPKGKVDPNSRLVDTPKSKKFQQMKPLDIATQMGLPEWPEDADPNDLPVKKPHR